MWSIMANFEAYQEYQRIEDFEEDSPPGEEDLLVHVPEGLKGKYVIQITMFYVHFKSFTQWQGWKNTVAKVL